MCIAAWMTAKYNANHNFPNSAIQARVRYVLFASIWTILLGSMYLTLFIFMAGNVIASIASHFLLYVPLFSVPGAFYSSIVLSLSLTWVFWLAAATALTQSLGGALNCNAQDKFVYCGHLNALEGFAWLIWFVFILTLQGNELTTVYRLVLTLMLLFVAIRGIMGARRGDDVTAPMVEV